MSAVIEPYAVEAPRYFERLLRLTGATPEKAICTAGQGDVALMLKLCREGYQRVECLKQATCACADGGMDVLLISGENTAAEAAAVLSRTVRVLRDGGVVALKLDAATSAGAVRAALAAAGLHVQAAARDVADPTLLALTVCHTAQTAVAA